MTFYLVDVNPELANQEFDVTFDGANNIHLLLQTVNNCIYLTVSINNEILGQPFLACPNRVIVPYPWIQERLGGNFVFKTENNNYPNFENFGTTCNLYFVTLDEL